MTAWWSGLELKHYPPEALRPIIMKGVDEDGMTVGPSLRLSASKLWLERNLDSDVAVKARKVLKRASLES